MKLSILTPAVPTRIGALTRLMATLRNQIGTHAVEHLILIDNYQRSVGAKRNALLNIAQGDYVAFMDDDDIPAEGYVPAILSGMDMQPDVVTFIEDVVHNGLRGKVQFGADHAFAPFTGQEPVIQRYPTHVCAWKRSMASRCAFPPISYAEDEAWARAMKQMWGKVTEAHIPHVLRYYRHEDATSEAMPS